VIVTDHFTVGGKTCIHQDCVCAKLGLTYRDVEQAGYELAAKRDRPDFILHISRLADIENRNVVPSLHKLYSLATIYHLSPPEIW